MSVHSNSSFMVFVLATLGVNSQSPVMTESKWSEFQCFNDEEIEQYHKVFNIDSTNLDINGEFSIISDDYTLRAYVASILQRELFGINVYLWDFYDDAATFVAFMAAVSSRTMAVHWGVLKKDVVEPPDGQVSRSIPSFSSHTAWAIRGDVAQDLEEQLLNDLGDGCDLFLGQWRSFTKNEVIAAMDNASTVVIPPRDDGTMPCAEWYGCMYGDSTWYPPHCDPIASNCTVLLQFLPEHDSELNRDLILNYNLSIVIKYMGSPGTDYGQSNFRTFYGGKYRVIFQLRSIDIFSAEGYGWNSIVLPMDEKINDKQLVVGVSSTNTYSQFMGQFMFSRAVALQQFDVDWIYDQIFRATNNGAEDETKDIRMQATCDWMKTSEGKKKWEGWLTLPTDNMFSGPPCSSVNDHILQILDDLSQDEIWDTVWFDSESQELTKLQQDVAGVIMDASVAVYVKRNCIKDHEDEQNLVLLLFGYCVLGFAVVLLIMVVVITAMWRKQEIIISSSIKMTVALYLGAGFALSVAIFSEKDIVSHCIMRVYVVQMGLTLMFGPLAAKIWKVSVIHENIKLLRTTDISEQTQMKRVGIVLLLVIGFLCILLILFPIEVQMNIVNGDRTRMCEWDGSAETAYDMLLLVEGLVFIFVARTAWSIKSVNDVYNEHKWIGSTFLGAVLIVAGYLIVSLLERNSTTLMVQSMLISIMTMWVISLLMIPKFRIIWSGKVYCPDSFEHDSLSFASSLLTKEDLKRMRSLLRKFGYRVIKKDSRGHMVETSASGSAWSRGLSKGVSRLWGSKRKNDNSFLSKEGVSSRDVQVSLTL